MKIGKLFRGREAAQYPSIGTIIGREIKAAHTSFPNANGDDLTALALSTSSLRKNLGERTAERDTYGYKARQLEWEANIAKRQVYANQWVGRYLEALEAMACANPHQSKHDQI